jgi:hypothetical protein
VKVIGAIWRAVMRIMTGVGELVQRIESGRTGWVQDGWVIERSSGIVWGQHRARGDEERVFPG